MKTQSYRRSRYRLTSYLVICAAVIIACLVIIRNTKEPFSSSTSLDSSPSSKRQNTGVIGNQAALRNPRKASQSAMQWLAGLSSGEGTVRDKLAQLPSGFLRHDIIALWNDILTDGELVRNGQLPGMEKAESEMIFNALLDGLVERGATAQENGNELETEAVTKVFTQLISALQCDGVLRDYAIQRGLILAADSLPANTQGRGEIINTALAQITPDNINEFHVGTALNTFLSFKSQWSYAERKQIRDTINRLVLDLPNETKESFIQATDTPSMQVRVPLLTAIGAWGIEAGLPLLTQAISSGKPALQIPGIAAWSQLPSELRASNQMHDQIKTWAASDNPLRFAASNAIRSTEIYPQQFDF